MDGDEFTVFMQNINTPENARMVAQKINTALALPYPALGKELFASASIGIALYPDDGSTTDALLRSADVAMYYAKHHGKNMLKFYARELDSHQSLQLELQNGLRDALENNELEVHYQPLVAVDCGRIIGMEALVRWRHPEKGLIMPDVFIAAAETSDLI
jgi:predicted signal transduction protein with EAL and GGDEF domain